MQREQARSETIPQLEAAGLQPKVFLSPCDAHQPAGGRGNAIVSHQAIQAAVRANTDLLFCEDDIDLASDFPRFLELARRAARVTYLYLHEPSGAMTTRYGLTLTQAILKRERIPAGLYELQERRNLGGAQCVYLPREFLQVTRFETLAAGGSPIDIWLSNHLHGNGITPLVALPHPVQHRQVRVARRMPNATNPDKYSRSFHLERRWPT